MLCCRNILLSIVLAVPFITMIYVLMNVSYLTVLSVQEMMDAPAVAVVSCEKLKHLSQYYKNYYFKLYFIS